MRITLWVILTVLLGAGAATARADSVTLDVSATLSPTNSASCAVSGCTLSGTLVVDSATGTLLSADVEMSGETPVVNPLTVPTGTLFASTLPGGFSVQICNSDFCLVRGLITQPAKILQNDLGNGQNISNQTFSNILFVVQGTETGITGNIKDEWVGTIGTLSSPIDTPEPSSLGLMLAGIGLLLVTRTFIGKHLLRVSRTLR